LNSVTAARNFARRALTGWDAQDWEWAVSQVLTELATNAVIHAHTRFEVDLSFDGEQLRVAVTDGSVRPPVRRDYSARATTGRGVCVVESLAGSWGVDPHPDGKTVWCALRADDGERAAEPKLEAFLSHLDEFAAPVSAGSAAKAAGRRRQSTGAARGRAA
jgi:anti-sigma regulatory factor (Ser/Thr protein kinase)